MKRIITIVGFAALAMLAASCSKSRAEQMALAENVKVECTPEILTAVAGEIPVSITVTCPEGYFHPKATMVVTPVLVYEGGEAEGPVYKYQGDKVKDNNKVISKNGGSVKEKFNFEFKDGMQVSHLELRSKAFYKNDVIDIPAIKVADGVNVTYQLVDLNGAYSLKDDGYQNVIHTSTEGQILYDVNSASVKSSELRNSSVNGLKQTLKETKENERAKVTGTKIIAYASPEGGQNYNAKLSDKRAGTAEQAWAKISKGMEASSTEIQSVGQDWEGFQQAVSASNIEDKDLILRVLSMYSDPAVRESEIRNMSQIFTEMNKKVFPSLRRARFITEVEYQNYSDEELKVLARERLEEIGEDGLLRLATLSEDRDEQEVLYEMAAEKFNSQKAIYNLAAIALDKGFAKETNKWLAKVEGRDADAINAQGVLALREGDFDKAMSLFERSNTEDAKQNKGVIEIMRGNYDAAAALFSGAKGHNAALANILTGNYDKAEEALTDDDAMSNYLRAIIAARKGNVVDVKVYLSTAAQKDPELGVKAAKDIEFADFR